VDPGPNGLKQSAAVRLRALRGATTVEHNESGAILEATEELVRAVMERNSLGPKEMVSCIFTCTGDLDAEFPAVAARNLGLSGVPLLCTREIDVPGSHDPADASLLRRPRGPGPARLPA
jgi:chorismate mutase